MTLEHRGRMSDRMPQPSTVGWALDPALRHLNHASFGAVPDDVASEQDRLRRVVESNPTRWFATLPERIAEARARVARLLGVDADGLAFVLNASAGASVIYGSLLSRGPVDVMTTDHGYGAVTMGAQRLAARTGGRATRVDVPLAATSAEVLRLLTEALERERPQLLVIDQVTSATARAFTAEEICRVAGSLGVLTLVDGAHVPGAVAAPVVSSADYWVGNLHKFACAPRGAAVLVVRELGAFVDDPLPDVGQPVGWMRLLRLPEPLGRTRQAADALRVPFTAEAGIVAAFTSFKDEGYRRLSAHAYSSPDDFAEVATVGVRLLDEWSRERPGATSSG